MTEVAQYIDLPGIVTRVERVEPTTIGDPCCYEVRVDCPEARFPLKVELLTPHRPEVEQRCYVTVTFYEETP